VSNEAGKLLVCGTRTLAEEVADLASTIPGVVVAGFVENLDHARCQTPLRGLPVIWHEELPRFAGDHLAIVALATTKRSIFTDQVAAAGVRFATLIHPTAHVSPTATLGEGCFVGAGAVIAAYTSLGAHVFVNRGVLIGHHTTLGHHVSLMPGANVAGLVTIGAHTFVGMGAIVLDRISIGEHCVVGSGALVTKDAPARVQLMGLPARIVKQDIEGK
jgi:sugar O-acyltransferase (sialic acid O-acetyltransferase NeuD family)